MKILDEISEEYKLLKNKKKLYNGFINTINLEMQKIQNQIESIIADEIAEKYSKYPSICINVHSTSSETPRQIGSKIMWDEK